MMMKRFFALLALAVCVSSEASAFFVSRGGAQKAVGKAAKAKVVTVKKCVLLLLFVCGRKLLRGGFLRFIMSKSNNHRS